MPPSPMAVPGASTGTERNTPSFRDMQERADRLESQGLHSGEYFLELKQSTVRDREREYKQKAPLAALSFAFLTTSYDASQVCASVLLSVFRAQDDSVETLEALRDLKLPPLDKARSHLQGFKELLCKSVPDAGHGSRMHLQQIESLVKLVSHQNTFPDSLREDLDKVAEKCTAAKEGEVRNEKDALRNKKRVKLRKPAHKIKVKLQHNVFAGRDTTDCTEKKEPVWDRCFKIGLLKKQQKLLDTLTREYVALEAQSQIVRSECYGLHKHMQSNKSLVRRISDSRFDVIFVQEITEQLIRNQNHFKEMLSGTKVQVLLCFELINRARWLVWRKLASVLGSPNGF